MNMTVHKNKRIIVKVGSSLVTNNGEGLDHAAIAMWAEQMATLLGSGHEVLMVSSGAIAEGMQRLGWTKRPQEIHQLQAAAAVGQMGLVQVYESCFARFNLRSAQVLLTNADLANSERNANAKATLDTLLKLGVVPIINENDTVVTDEIKFGDNDSLAALVANLIHADLLVILTDQGGLFTADPSHDATAVLLSKVVAGDPALEKMAGGAGSELSKGGMLTKVLAAKVAAQTGTATVIASGREAKVLTRLLAGEQIGTYFSAK
jgi:glutamate 5-kinase